jgi:hypothetical protein
MELALNREYDVQILLRLNEVSKIRSNYLSGFGVRVHSHTQVGFFWLRLLLLLLLWLLKHKLLSYLVERLIVVLLVSDVVWYETCAHQTELLLHRESSF